MLILASASPRRRDLLTGVGIRFRVEPAGIPEETRDGESPEALTERLALEKAAHVASRLGADESTGAVVLGSDTVVVRDTAVLGKPRDPAHARELLGSLVGREHRVVTAVAVGPAGATERADWQIFSVSSRVTMHPASATDIERYVATGEPLDKAGAYAFQGEGRRFVRAVVGSETNVIGLPIEETLAVLEQFGIVPEPAAPQ